MSYDLDAFRPRAGLSAREHYESEAFEESLLANAEPTPGLRAAMMRLADALHALDPTAERRDDGGCIEISTDAVQVSLYAGGSSVTLPYWFTGAEADAAVTHAFACARVLRDTGGYAVYDPQTGLKVGEDGDEAAAREAYAQGAAALAEQDRRARRPWWRRRRRR